MPSFPYPINEAKRIQELYSYGILDSESEQDFSDIAELASEICKTPVSLISLIDEKRQWIKAHSGMPVGEMDREISFCTHTIISNEPLIVKDAAEDSRFANNPLVVYDPGARFYAGFPLVTPTGNSIGTLCILDRKPRTLTKIQLKTLTVLSKQVMNLIEERSKSKKLKELSELEHNQKETLEKIVMTQEKIFAILGHDTRAPLYAVNNILKLAADGHFDKLQLLTHVDSITNQLDATLLLIEDLLKWSQLRSNCKFPQESCNIYDTINFIFELLSVNAEVKNLHLINDVPKDCVIKSSSPTISFILRNLVSNAIKFTKDGFVNVRMINNGLKVKIIVEDTGIGMDSNQQKKYLTGMLESTLGTDLEQGSGLATVMINELLQSISATLEIESVPGKGSSIGLLVAA